MKQGVTIACKGKPTKVAQRMSIIRKCYRWDRISSEMLKNLPKRIDAIPNWRFLHAGNREMADVTAATILGKKRHLSSVKPHALTNRGRRIPGLRRLGSWTRYWVVHLLQHFAKLRYSRVLLKRTSTTDYISKRYVVYYLFTFRRRIKENRSRQAQEDLIGDTLRSTQKEL